jgi:SlyX protein
MTPERLEERLTELEIKLGYAEDLLDTLNALVARQQEQIERLARELVALRLERESDPAPSRAPLDERPPHY